jgi:rhamnogalacturonan hydrolase
MFLTTSTLIQFFLLPLLVVGQLSGKVGPTTSRAAKAAKKCNITSYGAKPGRSGDIGPALTAAFNACKTGGTIVIPAGDWGLGTWVNFNGGSGWALQWDGVIYRNGQAGGNMLLVQRANDVEFYSTTGKGAFQGNGYEFHAKNDIKGPRILRFVKTTNFSVHDLAFADAPSFHFSMDTCKNGEVYNMAIRGANRGGLDGIDVWSDNVWLHDVSEFEHKPREWLITLADHGDEQGRVCNSEGIMTPAVTIAQSDTIIEPGAQYSRREYIL